MAVVDFVARVLHTDFFDYCISQATEEQPIEPEIVEDDADTQVDHACAERARHVERECLAAGGDAETCARGARRAYLACVEINEGNRRRVGRR